MKFPIPLVFLLFACSCTEQQTLSPEKSIEFYKHDVSFLKRTESLAGHKATDCTLDRASSREIYNCISYNYTSQIPFYAYISRTGIDSTIWSSAAYNGKSLFILSHDTFAGQPKYSGFYCSDATLHEYRPSKFQKSTVFFLCSNI